MLSWCCLSRNRSFISLWCCLLVILPQTTCTVVCALYYKIDERTDIKRIITIGFNATLDCSNCSNIGQHFFLSMMFFFLQFTKTLIVMTISCIHWILFSARCGSSSIVTRIDIAFFAVIGHSNHTNCQSQWSNVTKLKKIISIVWIRNFKQFLIVISNWIDIIWFFRYRNIDQL